MFLAGYGFYWACTKLQRKVGVGQICVGRAAQTGWSNAPSVTLGVLRASVLSTAGPGRSLSGLPGQC